MVSTYKLIKTDPETQEDDNGSTNSLSPVSVPNKNSSDSKLSASTSKSQSLALPSSANNKFTYPSFSELLEGVMAANSAVSREFQPVSADSTIGNDGFEGQFRMSHQEVLASVTAKAARAQMQLLVGSTNSSNEKSPVTQSETSVRSPSDVIQKQLSSPHEKANMQEGDMKNATSHTTKPPKDIAKTPNSDGYSWRKYGQKQVKNSESSRSYYRCTYSDCHAKKKVQHSDVSGCIIGVVYKGHHDHDPPQRIKGPNLRRRASLAEFVAVTDSGTASVQKLGHSDLPTCGKENEEAVTQMPEPRVKKSSSPADGISEEAEEQHGKMPDPSQRLQIQQTTSIPKAKDCQLVDPDEFPMTDCTGEHDDAPQQKRRMKEKGKSCPNDTLKIAKDPKVVVHAAGDVGILSDGYRWRKYGQKMVKGNPHPRSYYRCTSAGCLVRKHVERATDSSTAIVVTYNGKHDHDMPVPKKRHGPSNTGLLVTAPVSNVPLQKTRISTSEGPPTQWSMDANGNLTREKASELGAEKMLESAQTLLSIGIELKSC
ncbi:hypothetical protein Nepgr_015243 [Nepenthes gracilis]|uniref:WRKY domain-containing protein n=1 Tax=Nepenthes gracilis TaxID=150966 RepID=A0AAD3SLS0_NEPGR|nr:hypothetical protein Nepgr_015243 [Nepenthes gracilis]